MVAAIRPPYPKLVDVRVEELRPAVEAEQQDRDESDGGAEEAEERAVRQLDDELYVAWVGERAHPDGQLAALEGGGDVVEPTRDLAHRRIR
jgi:hypothetical protein